MAQVPIAPDLFTWPDREPQLIGSACDECDAVTFPSQEHCPRCGRMGMTRRLLPRRGTLVTWTTQEFLPKAPYAGDETEETFRPFGVGLVQLGKEVRVESRLTTADVAQLRIGMEMELTVLPFRAQDDGTEIMVFAFRPAS